MEPVKISDEGITHNILSLNYTTETMLREYINNVISKNDNGGYKIKFSLKMIRQNFQFIFEEENSIGFKSLEEIKKAYKIADSERTGTNNMGYGIYSPITLCKDYDSFNLFIQNTESGKLYSISKFDCEKIKITTEQGEFVDGKISGVDCNSIIPENGTKSIWISGANIGDIASEENEVIKYIKKQHREFQKKENIDDEDIDITNIGKMYYNEIQNKDIYYGDRKIEPINLINEDEEFCKTYKISILTNRDNNKDDYRIKGNDSGEDWKNFNDTSRKPIGAEYKKRKLRSGSDEQKAKIIITDLGEPKSIEEKSKRTQDKRIWVRLDGIYIFSEEFTMNGWPNIRAIIDIKNDEGENKFDKFISPNANKSNSKINSQLKSLITCLIKYVANNEFPQISTNRRKSIPQKIKGETWEKHMGNCFRHKCFVEQCSKEITVLDCHYGHNVPYREGGEDTVDNLRPICPQCNSGMGSELSIDEWNIKLKSHH